MDTVIIRKNKKIRLYSAAAVIILVLGGLTILSATKKKSLNVNSGEIVIKQAEMANFEDFIIFQAKVEPMNAILVNIVEGGSVQEIFAENGQMVTKGQALAKMYNPNTELGYLTQETAIIEQINNLNTGKLNIRNQELSLAKDLVMIEHDFNDAKRLYDINERLFKKDIISKNEWNTTQENFRYQQKRKDNIELSIRKERQTNQIQISQINRSIATMELSLQILRKNKLNFLITAPESGQLTSFEPIIGKTYQAGESIGKIDRMNGYKLIAQIDEFYLERLAEGQKGEVEYKGKVLSVTVLKVLPEVRNGRFQAELSFDASDIQLQQGLSLGVKLILSAKDKKLVVPKGSFYQQSAGKYVFVVNGNSAERRAVKLGRENPFYYEVLEGLSAGEKIITSSYGDYTEVERLEIESNQ